MPHLKRNNRLAELFNEHYINIIERSSGLKPEKSVCHDEDFDKKIVFHNIIRNYENHSSITKIKNSMPVKSHLSSNNTLTSVRQVTSDKVNLILNSNLSTPKRRLVRTKYQQNW